MDLGTLGCTNSACHGFAGAAGDRAAPAVGSAETAAGTVRAALSNGGPLQDLGDLLGGPNSFATAANATGLVVGGAETPTPARHAFLASTSAGVVQDLQTLGDAAAAPLTSTPRAALRGWAGRRMRRACAGGSVLAASGACLDFDALAQDLAPGCLYGWAAHVALPDGPDRARRRPCEPAE